MQEINERYSSSFADEYQKNIDAYLRINGEKIKMDRGAIAGTLDNTAFGEAMVQMWESTLPKEFKSVTLSQQAKNLQSYADALSITDKQAEKIKEERKYSKRPSQRLVLKSLGEKELKNRIDKTLDDIGVSVDQIQKFDEQLASSDIERDLIAAGSEGVPELLSAISALAGDQVARLPTMLIGGSFISEVGNHYWENVKAVAEKEGLSPQQVIESGKADPSIAEFTGKLSGSLEYVGMGKIVGVLKNAVKNTVKKNAIQVLASGGVEGVTEGLQGAVGQMSQSLATGENKFDLYGIANEALAGATMGMVFAAPGIATSSNPRSYTLNDQQITRKTAREMIEAGKIEGLTVNNDPALEKAMSEKGAEVSVPINLEDNLGEVDDTNVVSKIDENISESPASVNNKDEAISFIKENTQYSDVEVDKIATEIDEVAASIAEQENISKEEAYTKIDIEKRLTNDQQSQEIGGISQEDIGDGVTGEAGNIDQTQETLSDTNQEETGGDIQQPSSSSTKEDILSRRQEIVDRLKKNTGDKLSSGIDPEVLADYVRLAKTYIDEGIVNVKEFSEKFKQEAKKLFGIDLDDAVIDQVYNSAKEQEVSTKAQAAPAAKASKETKKSPVDTGESFDLGVQGIEGSFKKKSSGSIQLMAKREGKKVGFFNVRPVKKDGKKYYSIQDVAVNPKEEGKGIGTSMYRKLMENLPEDVSGIISPQKSRKNKTQVPTIHQKLAKDYSVALTKEGDVIFNKEPESADHLTCRT